LLKHRTAWCISFSARTSALIQLTHLRLPKEDEAGEGQFTMVLTPKPDPASDPGYGPPFSGPHLRGGCRLLRGDPRDPSKPCSSCQWQDFVASRDAYLKRFAEKYCFYLIGFDIHGVRNDFAVMNPTPINIVVDGVALRDMGSEAHPQRHLHRHQASALSLKSIMT
jgi:hypothetical protein